MLLPGAQRLDVAYLERKVAERMQSLELVRRIVVERVRERALVGERVLRHEVRAPVLVGAGLRVDERQPQDLAAETVRLPPAS